MRRENQQLLLQYELLNKQLGEVDHVLAMYGAAMTTSTA
jgi:hypothetical protein